MVVASKGSDNGGMEYQYHRPQQLTKWQAFQKAIYDKNTHQFLGRTGKGWGQILLFYLIFYAILAALFAICMQGLFATLDKKAPKWQLDSSLIGQSPGLGFRPISDQTEEGSIIQYNTTDAIQTRKWVNLIDRFLEPYKKPQTGENFQNCDFGMSKEPGKVCYTNTEPFKSCDSANSYGYNTTSPCVFLKLNRIFNWTPDYYTNYTSEMPLELQQHIERETNKEQIWVSCQGMDSADKERVAKIQYFPQAGFPGYYYPYTNDPNYLSPLVAVQFTVEPNVIVRMECRAWAKNIEYRSGVLDRAGSVVFEIRVDVAKGPSAAVGSTTPHAAVGSTTPHAAVGSTTPQFVVTGKEEGIAMQSAST